MPKEAWDLERLEKVRQNIYEPLIFPENDLILPDLGHNKGIRRGSETKKIRQKRLFLNALTHCQSRHAKAIDFHWNAALCALNLAKWPEERCAKQQRFSAQSCKQRNGNQRLLEVFITRLGLDLNTIKYYPEYQSLCHYGVIAP